MAALDQMQTDWTNYLNNSKVRDVQAYGPTGGTLTRTDTGATFKTPGGATYDWNAQNPDFGTQASRSPELADYWNKQYGYQLPGASGDTASTVQSFYDKSLPEMAQYKINPATDTVQGQMAGMLDSGSPFIQRAQTRATQAMNGRGLTNSSMNATAGEAAAIDASLPIASQDASTYANTGQFNVGQVNQQKMAQTQGAIQSGLQAQQIAGQKQMQGAQIASAEKLAAQSNALQTSLQTLKGTQATDLANIEAQYKTLIQTNASAANIYATSIQYMTEIMGSTLDPEAKKVALNNQINLMNGSLGGLGKASGIPGLNLLLDFSASWPGSAANTTATTNTADATPDVIGINAG